MKIAIDFDGTCTTHSFPEIGHDIGAVPVLKKLVENGHDLILYTMRSNMITFDPTRLKDDITPDHKGDYLNQAIRWFLHNDIKLWAVQTNPEQKLWTESNKCYAHYYIDDAAIGCPLIWPVEGRPYVDWKAMQEILEDKGLIL